MLQLRSLQHLVVLARRLNYARAAEEVGISQSALSRSIQALEKQLGMRFFDRDRTGVSLTPQGRTAVESANILLAEAQDLERQLIQSGEARSGRVRFGMAPMPARVLLPGVMSASLGDTPEIAHEVAVRDADALWALLVAGDIEFFVINDSFTFDSPAPRSEMLGHFPLSLIVRAGHPLLAGDCPDRRFPVLRSTWSGIPLPAYVKDRMLGTPNVIEDFGALAALTATSDAIWMSSTYAVIEEIRAGQLVELPLPEADNVRDLRMVMYSLPRRSQSPLALALKKALRQQIQAVARAAGGTPSA